MATASGSAEISAVPSTQLANALLKSFPSITDQEPGQRYYLTATFLFPRNFISILQGWGVPPCLPKRRNKWEKRGCCLHLFEEQPLTFTFWGRKERNGVCPIWRLFWVGRGSVAQPPEQVGRLQIMVGVLVDGIRAACLAGAGGGDALMSRRARRPAVGTTTPRRPCGRTQPHQPISARVAAP